MKSLFFSLIMLFASSSLSMAQDNPFKTRIYNKEYDVFIQMDLSGENITIPGQEILGKVFGYLRKTTDSRVWAIMSADIDASGKKAVVEMVNDYGSDDLVAEITVGDDGTYTLRQKEGSTMRVAGNGKWIKLPKVMKFTRIK